MAQRITYKLYGLEQDVCRVLCQYYGTTPESLAKQCMLQGMEALTQQMERSIEKDLKAADPGLSAVGVVVHPKLQLGEESK